MELLYLDPESEVTKDELEQSFNMYSSDRRIKPDYTGIVAMLTKANPDLIKRKLRPTRFTGVAIRPPADSGYRVKTREDG